MKRKRVAGPSEPSAEDEKRGKCGEHALTEEEAALYDRQLRLWGVEAQKRMRGAKVLVIGLSGVTGEVCKNAILSGIGALTMVDWENACEADLDSVFFLPESSLGENRALAAQERMQELNPKVVVRTMNQDIGSLTDAFIREFDCVLASNCDRNYELRFDKLCSEHGIGFFSVHSFGFYSYYYCNLNGHNFVEEIETVDKDGTVGVETVKGSLTCPSLSDALAVPWKNLRKQRVSKEYFALRLVSDMLGTDDESAVLSKKNEYLKAKGVPETFVSNDVIRELVRSRGIAVSPFSAILGGILGQEVIRVLSGKDRPIDNFVFFNGHTNVAVVDRISPASPTQSMSKPQVVLIEL